MIRFSLLLFLGIAAFGDDTAEKLNQIEDLFRDSGEGLDTQNSCSGIYGDLSNGCFECYLCDDARIKHYPNPTKLSLKHKSCDTTTSLCCLPQVDLSVKSISTCGMMKKTVRRTAIRGVDERTSVRSVLVGEHPWRAWVYRKGGTSPSDILCAATVIDENAEVVMTTASCVIGRSSRDLSISFSRSLDEEVDVTAVLINDKYKLGRPHVHDIALLRMSTARGGIPSWVSPVCLPRMAAMHATTCITVSDNDRFINTVIPLQKKCAESGVQEDAGQRCAVAPPQDYAPEHGAALLCQDELHTGDFNYFVYGIALVTNNSVTTYTDIFKYELWINRIIS